MSPEESGPATLDIEDQGAVRIVRMNRPEALNAFNVHLIDDLAEAFLTAADDDRIKVLVLTGAGKAFTAGADLKEMGSAPQPRHGFPVLMEAMIDFPKPFIVAVNGVGAGIGATICGIADLVYMSEAARLRCPFSSLGLTAEAGSTFLFPRLMGHQRAFWVLQSSEWMNASDCLEAGLVLEVLPPAGLMHRTLHQAQTLAELPLASLRKTKWLMMEPIRDQLKEVVARENRELAAMVGQPANREALAAFREKRDPDFSGL